MYPWSRGPHSLCTTLLRLGIVRVASPPARPLTSYLPVPSSPKSPLPPHFLDFCFGAPARPPVPTRHASASLVSHLSRHPSVRLLPSLSFNTAIAVFDGYGSPALLHLFQRSAVIFASSLSRAAVIRYISFFSFFSLPTLKSLNSPSFSRISPSHFGLSLVEIRPPIARRASIVYIRHNLGRYSLFFFSSSQLDTSPLNRSPTPPSLFRCLAALTHDDFCER